MVDSFSRIVRLGEGVGETGLLSDAAIDRTIAALKICAERIAASPASRMSAPSPPRRRGWPPIPTVLIARARAEAGIALDVISAEEEADLAALGCAPLIGRKYKGALIFDIGGGSTEIIWQHKEAGGPLVQDTSPPRCRWGWSLWRKTMAQRRRSRAGFETMRGCHAGALRAASRTDATVSIPAANICWAPRAR